uniref:Uncharacterized protein n=1 Tax=Anguilla anguilla TaxID=7936 RepID=A0A0E9P5S3_ANGAN
MICTFGDQQTEPIYRIPKIGGCNYCVL